MAGRINNSALILVYLSDGGIHQVSEFYDDLARNINPAVAMRSYKTSLYRPRPTTKKSGTSRSKRADWTLEQKIDEGKKRSIWHTITGMSQRELILLDKHDSSDTRAWSMMLTEMAFQSIKASRERRGYFWAAVRFLHERGRLKLTVLPHKNTEQAAAS